MRPILQMLSLGESAADGADQLDGLFLDLWRLIAKQGVGARHVGMPVEVGRLNIQGFGDRRHDVGIQQACGALPSGDGHVGDTEAVAELHLRQMPVLSPFGEIDAPRSAGTDTRYSHGPVILPTY